MCNRPSVQHTGCSCRYFDTIPEYCSRSRIMPDRSHRFCKNLVEPPPTLLEERENSICGLCLEKLRQSSRRLYQATGMYEGRS